MNNPDLCDILYNLINSPNDIIYSLYTYPELKFKYISPSFEQILGYSSSDLIKDPLLIYDIIHKDDLYCLNNKLEETIDHSSPNYLRLKHKNSNYIWFEDCAIPILNSEGIIIGYNGICRNIHKRKEQENRFKDLSYLDGLTKLYNQAYFKKVISILNQELNTSIGLIVCDLDNLKYVNDTFGHSTGDRLLIEVSKILQDNVDKNSIISRIGGDEFAIIIKSINDVDNLKSIYIKLHSAFKTYSLANPSLPIKISMGCSFCKSSLGVTDELFNIADKNMYNNKIKRKNSILL